VKCKNSLGGRAYLVWHNFVKVGDIWIKIRSLVYK